jgi:hypothetical protein
LVIQRTYFFRESQRFARKPIDILSRSAAVIPLSLHGRKLLSSSSLPSYDLGKLHFQIAIVQLHERVAGMHMVPMFDIHIANDAGNLREDVALDRRLQ